MAFSADLQARMKESTERVLPSNLGIISAASLMLKYRRGLAHEVEDAEGSISFSGEEILSLLN